MLAGMANSHLDLSETFRAYPKNETSITATNYNPEFKTISPSPYPSTDQPSVGARKGDFWDRLLFCYDFMEWSRESAIFVS
jgi:hypothetical protein